jgi:hypothetical protein
MIHELRDLDEARRFLVQGLWLQRVLPPSPETLRSSLEWAFEIVSAGQPLPPVGFVADLGHVAFDSDWEGRANREMRAVPGAPAVLVRSYEDHVLGKTHSDWTFAEASEVLRTYKGRDRARGLAFVINQFRERAGFGGVDLSPGIIKTVLDSPPEETLTQAWDSLDKEGVDPLLIELYQSLVASARHTAEMLGREDLFELTRRTALDDFGQRLALRQVLQMAHRMEDQLPRHRLRPLAGRREVPTHVLDEDTYPVGGFSSLSTRGSIESLLHSQLAFMELAERPDLFDIKYLRDELLYYARDENQFLRRRRTFAFLLFPDLVHARFKDATLPVQRIVLLLALLYVTVRKLSEWLSTDALHFVFFFLTEGEGIPLGQELALLRTLLHEPIENGTVTIAEQATLPEALQQCLLRGRRSLCHCLTVSQAAMALEPNDQEVMRLQVDGACPGLAASTDTVERPETEEPQAGWQAVLEQVLRRWI